MFEEHKPTRTSRCRSRSQLLRSSNILLSIATLAADSLNSPPLKLVFEAYYIFLEVYGTSGQTKVP